VTLTGESTGGPEHNAPPLVNRRHFPRLNEGAHDTPAVDELVRAKSFDRSISTIWEGDATLSFGAAPNEEHTALAPVRVGKGYRFTFAYSVNDLETITDLRGKA
jgi:acetoacetate decarboxylase